MITTKGQIKTRKERFLELLPQIQQMARWAFRRCPREEREEAVAEVIAHAWVGFQSLMDRGLEDRIFATPLAKFAIKRVRSGRCVGCSRNVNDITSPYAQRERGIELERLDRYDERHDRWRQILVEDRHAGPAETAAMRIDFAAWLKEMPRRMRRIAKHLAEGHSTGRVARRFQLSDGRISQMRREMRRRWDDFQGGAMFA
jgi:uncharacterized protein (DUF924 family)